MKSIQKPQQLETFLKFSGQCRPDRRLRVGCNVFGIQWSMKFRLRVRGPEGKPQ